MHARYALTFERGARRQSLRDRALALGLRLASDCSDMLLVADEQTRVAVAEGFAVIGQMFDGVGRRVDEPASILDVESGRPRGDAWGNFLLFSTRRGISRVYRDPSGSIPAYRVRDGVGEVFVSDAEFACSLGLIDEAEVDLGFAIHWLQFPYLRTAGTGIHGVRELVPGTEISLSQAGWSEQLSWTPWAHACSAPPKRNDGEVREELRSTAELAIAAQASGSTVLLQLSGGLDSSIIAACLAQAGSRLAAVNFASRSADGDERHHARAVADQFGIPLCEILEEDLQFTILPPGERRFRPGSNPILVPLDEAVEKHRCEIGAELLVDGGGGDNLFCYLPGAVPVLDALRAKGPTRALRALDDVATLGACGLWDVAREALRRALPSGWWTWKEDRRFLRRDALLRRSEPHPWLDAPFLALAGKREHVASLVHIQHFLDRRVGCASAVLHPLMAQPLMEFCLAIPTWEWVRGGMDRALAREAFKGLVPLSIIQRRSKGSLQGLFHRSFKRLRAELEHLLLSGRLVALGIADKDAIEKAFAADNWMNSEVQMRLSEMASLELWLQSWKGGAPRPPSTAT